MKTKNKALLIDDEKLVRKLLGKIVKDYGLEAIEVANGFEAQAELAKHSKELALAVIDLVIPDGAAGWELIDEMKKNEDTARIPVVVITGVMLSSRELEKLKQHARAVVSKQQFNVDEFKKVLGSLLSEDEGK